MAARRTVALLSMVAVLWATTVSVEAAKPRRAQGGYEMNQDNVAVGGPEPTPVVSTADTSKLYEFPIKKRERFVSVRLADDNEGDVAGAVTQWVMDNWYGDPNNGAGTGHAVTYVRFCNRTKKPVKLKPKIKVQIKVIAGTCEDGTPSTPTSGTITLDFFRK